jgi:hypothetical protein
VRESVRAIAETTKDIDLALDVRFLRDRPLIDDAMNAAGFRRDGGPKSHDRGRIGAIR